MVPPRGFQPTAYRVRLFQGQALVPVRDMEDRPYLVDLDLRPGEYAEESFRRLMFMYRRLLRVAGVTRDHDLYQLQVSRHPEDDQPWWWVPSRPDDEYGEWR